MRKFDGITATLLVAAALLLLAGAPAGGKSPIADPGLRVLITYPEATRDTLPAGQRAILDNSELRGWLDAHCVKTGGVPEWRIAPDNEIFGADQPIWQKLMALARGKGAWLLVSTGKSGVNEPLPADLSALQAILNRYGGAQ